MKVKDTGPIVTFTSEEVKAKLGQKVRSSWTIHRIPYGSIGHVVECYKRDSGEDEWGAMVEFEIQGRDETQCATFTKDTYYGYLEELDENDKVLPPNADWKKQLEEFRLLEELRNIGRKYFKLKAQNLDCFETCMFGNMSMLAKTLKTASKEFCDLLK